MPGSGSVSKDDDSDDPDRCHARTKKAGNPRCMNRRGRDSKATPLDHFTGEESTEFICARHKKEALNKSKGFYSAQKSRINKQTGDDGYIGFDGNFLSLLIPSKDSLCIEDWIPDYLSSDTKLAIRDLMMKPIAKDEKDGYIYAFEIRGTIITYSFIYPYSTGIKIIQIRRRKI
jgi:hypothetical protein